MDRLLGPQGIGQAGSDKVDTTEADEVIDAIAKTVAELTSQQDGVIPQQVIEQLMRQIMHYDGEFRREEATSAVGSSAKHWRFGSNGARGPMRPHPHAGQAGGCFGVQSQNRTAARQLQNIRLSSDWANQTC